MNADLRRLLWAFSGLALLTSGCSNELGPSTTSVLPTPPEVLAPEGPRAEQVAASEDVEKAGTPEETQKPDATDKKPNQPRETDQENPKPAEASVLLKTAASALLTTLQPDTPVAIMTTSIKDFQDRISHNKPGIKYTVLDGWATYCPPCKENFPHLVEMHEKFADQGLRVISVSFDDAESPDDIKKALAFLNEKKAAFENYVFSDGMAETYEFFDVNAIPAVFVYGADGKEVKRFTLDDPDNQFTYDEVEEYLKGLLAGKAK